jgi:predicted lipid carrier protein YhbT
MLRELPAFAVPRPIAAVVSRLPQRPVAFVLSRALAFGVGRVVSADDVAPLRGRRYVLVVGDLGLRVAFEATADGFRPTRGTAPADLTVSASLRDFVALALRVEDPDTLFFARRLRIEGDTELGLTVKNLLDGIDWPGLAAALAATLPAPLRRFAARR